MDIKHILSITDHTILKQTATEQDVLKIIKEGDEFKVASICIPPCFVKYACKNRINVPICTVIGFPNGYNTTGIKIKEAIEAVEFGADEIDMVINIGALKELKYDYVESEISKIKKAINGKVLKVIIETCLLSVEEKKIMCDIVTNSGTDYIKTSTGFSTSGARIEDIELFKKHLNGHAKIKAAGGIRTLEDAIYFIQAGADRIGSSSMVNAVVKYMEHNS